MEKTSLHTAFEKLRDPRIDRQKLHNLLDIIILSILAVLCGANGYEEIADYGKTNIAFLKQFLELKNGIPSHDTIRRVFILLKPQSFERCFAAWAQGLKDENIIERVIAFDGKTSRRTKDNFKHKSPLHSVHAWSVENGICLGQIACAEKSNEITAIPQLLDLLDIKDCIITIDAMGTQRAIAEKIIEKGGDYILAVKGNQGGLEEEVKATCKLMRSVSDTITIEKDHGRIETRRCEVFKKGEIVDFENVWKGVQSVVKITATRELPNKTETSERYYISSLSSDNKNFNKYIRDHWGVENSLHWVLDMVFREDEQRKREGHSAKNFAIIRKIVLDLLKKHPEKISIQRKRLKAAWNKEFLMDLLTF
jgi:predicted transposase YbfD/YdcC